MGNRQIQKRHHQLRKRKMVKAKFNELSEQLQLTVQYMEEVKNTLEDSFNEQVKRYENLKKQFEKYDKPGEE